MFSEVNKNKIYIQAFYLKLIEFRSEAHGPFNLKDKIRILFINDKQFLINDRQLNYIRPSVPVRSFYTVTFEILCEYDFSLIRN